MPDADEQLQRRLREELDRVQPLYSTPRYVSARHRPAILRLAPAVLAATVLAILGLTTYTRSLNPVVWTESVVNVVHPTTPTPQQQQTPPEHHQSPEPSESPESHASPEPSERPEPSGSPEAHESPEPSDSPEPHESPEPTGDHSGDIHTSDSGDTERS